MNSYASIEGINISTLKLMAISPKRYRHNVENPRPDTDTFRHGRLGHAAILEPAKLLAMPNWTKAKRDERDAEWLAFRDANEDYVRADELAHFVSMSLAVRDDPAVAPLLRSGVVETPVAMVDPRTGLKLKGRPDLRDGSRIVDLKLTKMALTERGIQKQIAGLLYHAQAAFYLDLCEADTFTWIFAEQNPPFDAVVVPATEDWIAAGRMLYQRWIDQLIECRSSGVWPGISGGKPMVIEIPQYAMPELELTMNGEELSL